MRLLTRCVLGALLLLIVGRAARAQVFEPGYLVLSRGDTLRGEVENAFWADPPKSVRYRAGTDGGITTFRTPQLRALQLASGRLLRRELLPVDFYAATDINRLSQGYVNKQQQDSVMADVLVEGAASLLTASLDGVQHFFVRRPGQPYVELTERRYLNGTRVVDANNYKGQLELYFGDCPAVLAALEKARFTVPDMVNMVQAYNEGCSAGRQPGRRYETLRSATNWPKVQVGVLLGARYISMRMRALDGPGQERQTLNGLQLDGRAHLQPGIYFDVVEAGRRLVLHSALLGYRFGRSVSVASPDGSAQWKGKLNWSGLNATLQVGLRGLRPLGAHYQLFAGSGVELPMYWVQGATLTYGSGAATTRSITGRVSVPTARDFDAGFGFNLLPYLEVGVQHLRFTGTLRGRLYGAQRYSDDMAVASVVDNSSNAYSLGYDYKARTIAVVAELGYRLNGDSDKKKK